MIAAINYATDCTYDCAGPLTLARSTDGGVTWQYTPMVPGRHLYNGIRNNDFIMTAWLGGSKWITVWESDPDTRHDTYAISEDAGLNWSEPEKLTIRGITSMAVADGHATIISGALGLQTSQFFRNTYGKGVSLDDIHYSNLVVPGPAAAGDWAMFE